MPAAVESAKLMEHVEPQSLKKLSFKSLKRSLDLFPPTHGSYPPPDPKRSVQDFTSFETLDLFFVLRFSWFSFIHFFFLTSCSKNIRASYKVGPFFFFQTHFCIYGVESDNYFCIHTSYNPTFWCLESLLGFIWILIF